MFGFGKKKEESKITFKESTESLESVFGVNHDSDIDILFVGIEEFNADHKCTWWQGRDGTIKWQKKFYVFHSGCFVGQILVDKIIFDTAIVHSYSVMERFYNLDKWPVMSSELISETQCNLRNIIEGIDMSGDLVRNKAKWQAKTIDHLKETDLPIAELQKKHPICEKTKNVNKFIDNYGV